jgi:hypothetical protein
MYSFPSSYRVTDQIIEIDLSTWDPGEDATDDQQRQDIYDLVEARAVLPALLDEVRRLRAERDKFCNRVDTLTAVAKGNKRHVQEMFRELQKARAALEGIRHLHKDSPMGPCPVCIDADAITAGGDGLMPYPCPTGRLAGAQDCDPPQRPAPSAAPAGDGQQQ